MTKVQALLAIWLCSLAVSAGLHGWGLRQPDPLQAPWLLVLALVLAPAIGFAMWLLGAQDHGERESPD
ncbi:hypothetical protein [Parasynechococcus sp.]|uniref:hypothetical protein n=1 Tax=Parasynechococcus sp. TaxID=3101203 RepID=UPI0037049D62